MHFEVRTVALQASLRLPARLTHGRHACRRREGCGAGPHCRGRLPSSMHAWTHGGGGGMGRLWPWPWWCMLVGVVGLCPARARARVFF